MISGLVDFFGGMTSPGLPDRMPGVGFWAISALVGPVIPPGPDITGGVFAVLMGMRIVPFGIREIVAAFEFKKASRARTRR